MDCWKECRWNRTSEQKREKAQILKRLEVKEVVQVTETKEKKKNREACRDGFICPSSRASQSSPAGAQALACQSGWTPWRKKLENIHIKIHSYCLVQSNSLSSRGVLNSSCSRQPVMQTDCTKTQLGRRFSAMISSIWQTNLLASAMDSSEVMTHHLRGITHFHLIVFRNVFVMTKCKFQCACITPGGRRCNTWGHFKYGYVAQHNVDTANIWMDYDIVGTLDYDSSL